MAPLTIRLLLCVACCALAFACTDDGLETPPAPEPSATVAIFAVLAPSATTAPAVPLAPTWTPAPTATPTAQPAAMLAPPAAGVAGPNPTAAPAPAQPARPAPITLRITLDTGEQTFEPHQIHGNFDDTVIVTLTGSDERHSFTVPVAGIDQAVERDRTSTVTFVLPLALGGPTAEGTFPFYCRFHGSPSSGMHGFLIFH